MVPLFAAILLLFFLSCDDAAVSKYNNAAPVVISLERRILLPRGTAVKQTASLELVEGAVVRTYGFIDTSFDLHPDDRDEIAAIAA
ncbi:MAG TPA: hypothetical protein P5077_10310, partial [bacterium]|nr:hypothetical protein [bacterium]